MADPVDKLEVLLNLDIGPLEDKVDDAIDEVERLDDQTTDNVQEEFEDAEEAADDLTESIEDADSESLDVDVDDGEVRQLRRRLAALDGRSVEIDTDVDRNRLRDSLAEVDLSSRSSPGRDRDLRLPGGLDEVAETAQLFGSLSAQTKLLIGSTAAAAAAIGTAGGLAAAAVALNKQFGAIDIRKDIRALKLGFRGAATAAADEFAPVVEQLVPVAEDLASAAAGAADELATFTGVTLQAIGVGEAVDEVQTPEGPGSGAAFLGQQKPGLPGPRKIQESDFSVSFGPQQQLDIGQTVPIEQLIGAQQKIRKEVILPIRRQIEALREQKVQGLVDEEEALSQIQSLRKKLDTQLRVLRQKLPDGVFSDANLNKNLRKLRDIRQRLEDIRTVSGQELRDATEQPADAEQVEGAGPKSFPTSSIFENIPDRIQAPSGDAQEGQRQVVRFRTQMRQAFQQLKSLQRVGAQAFVQLGNVMGSTVGQAFTDLIRNAVGFRNEIGTVKEAFKSLAKSALRVLEQIISRLVRAVAVAGALRGLIALVPGLNAIGGASSFGSILGNLVGAESGGRVKQDGVARIHKGEQIVPEGMVGRIQGLIRKTAQLGTVAPAGRMARRAPTFGVQKAGSESVQLTGDTLSFDIPVELITASNRVGARRQRRKGR